jgi:uncharacterized protein
VTGRGARLPGLCVGLAIFAGSGACRDAGRVPEEHGATPRKSAAGSVVWHELVASEPEAEARFYAEVVGWNARHDPDEHITLISGSVEAAGISRLMPLLRATGIGPRWVVRVAVEDVDAAVAKARLAGGQVALEPISLTSLRFAILDDPWGTALQITSPPAPSHDGERSGTFAWDELATPDGRGALQFFERVVGWTALVVTPLANKVEYVTLGYGETPRVGVFADPSLPRPYWVPYLRVADLDAAVGRATERGAKRLSGPSDVPDGRMAQLFDPEGAIFGLRESTKTTGEKP